MKTSICLGVLALPVVLVVGQLSLSCATAFADEYTIPPPAVVVKLEKAEAKPGAQLKGTLTMTIAEGWHCYPNPPSDPYCVPVYLSSDTKSFKLANVSYPPGVANPESGGRIYVGTVVIPFAVELPLTRGAHDFKIRMRYQQCDNSECLPPADLVSTIKVVVK